MNKSTSRKYAGEQAAAPLVEWLNGHREHQAERITKVVEGLVERRRHAKRELQDFLAHRRFGAIVEQVGERWEITWGTKEGSQNENDAVLALLELLRQDGLGRLKKCACGKWFFARLKEQTYCSGECQQDAYRHSDEYKKYRRQYMAEYRQNSPDALKKVNRQ